ncbi:MAG: UDP-N-acetylmuramate dehydrogenase [Bacillota bacterium]|nr:UDP-N-acetylmuramate dehydrogenase [Bacillota bacterium]
MEHYYNFKTQLLEIVGESNIQVDASMKDNTSFKVGGSVDILVTPESYEQVSTIIKLCNSHKVPYFILGNGSNLLVKDGGIRGIVIKFEKLDKIDVSGSKITAQSGSILKDVSETACNASLTGLEFACGIPGTVGGALAMNAGAYFGEMSDVVESSIVLDSEGNFRNLSKEELELGYRMSAVLKHNYIVLEVTFNLNPGEYDKIRDRIDDLMRRRIEKQPLEFPSAGSTFKRPEGHFAAKLIEDAGLKGANVGDAEVSVKHSGFIINKGNASAQDILDLITEVQKTVKDKFDVELHTEVRIIGEDTK